MSGKFYTRRISSLKYRKLTLGTTLRKLRENKAELLRKVAAKIDMDSTLLSKIELNRRFPTETQLKKLSKYFNEPLQNLTAHLIADRILTEYRDVVAIRRAVSLLTRRLRRRGD